MELPIRVVPNSRPIRFRWNQVVDTVGGKRTIEHEGSLPPTVETAVSLLIDIAKQLVFDRAAMEGRIQSLVQRVEELEGKDARIATSSAPAKRARS